LNPHFYERFSAYEFILLTQADAIIIKDELDYWCTQEYDYIGAPWDPAQPVALVTPDGQNKVVKIGVGNGGLSFRRNRKCIELLNEFPEANEGGVNSEDLFFSVYGFQSKKFSIPSRFVASRFSLECCPGFFYELNSNYLPMGSHAWWKYEPEFWFKMLHPDLEPMRDLALQEYAKSRAKIETNKQLYLQVMEARVKDYINKALDDLGEIERRG
jgi:hypothetical protein